MPSHYMVMNLEQSHVFTTGYTCKQCVDGRHNECKELTVTVLTRVIRAE